MWKYYAIRYNNTIVFRKTIKGLQKVTSTITLNNKLAKLTQVSYTGGQIIGTIPQAVWTRSLGSAIAPSGCIKISKETFLKFKPLMTWVKVEK